MIITLCEIRPCQNKDEIEDYRTEVQISNNGKMDTLFTDAIKSTFNASQPSKTKESS